MLTTPSDESQKWYEELGRRIDSLIWWATKYPEIDWVAYTMPPPPLKGFQERLSAAAKRLGPRKYHLYKECPRSRNWSGDADLSDIVVEWNEDEAEDARIAQLT